MSFKVVIACEDPTYDRYLAEPVVKAACRRIGCPNARVRTVTSPRVQGVDQLKAQACAFLEKWGGISDAVVFIVDADGQDGIDGRADRRLSFDAVLRSCTSSGCCVVVVAKHELEVWALWGCNQQMSESWDEIRAEYHPKERFFEPLISARDRKKADGGRRRLIEASLQKGWASLADACSELTELCEGLTRCRVGE